MSEFFFIGEGKTSRIGRQKIFWWVGIEMIAWSYGMNDPLGRKFKCWSYSGFSYRAAYSIGFGNFVAGFL